MRRASAKVAKLARPEGVRVAIYTRKSTDGGLEQEFNSLDAQRLACEQHVASHRAHGWTVLPELYDDGGFTGANTDRPAFKRLMQDAEAGLIDVVCVHKVDRISRSLADFVRVTAELQSYGVAFVSATQPFETGTPVGRMTLSLLAVFAEFEREMISERTRLKIHATRRKGMWTGGPVPLGYDLCESRLVVNEDEAIRVRAIFALFLDTGSIMATVTALRERAWLTKCRLTREGKQVESRPFTKSLLHTLLTNPVYIGRVRLLGETHAGAHESIVTPEIFDAVQAALAGHEHRTIPESRNRHGVLLRGLLRCAACGRGMTHSFTRKGSKAWGSYVCDTIQKSGAAACPGSRVAVGVIEAGVVERIRGVARDPQVMEATIDEARRELETRKSEIATEIELHEVERKRLERERDNLVAGIAKGAAALTPRLAAIEAELLAVAQRVDARHVESEQLAARVVDADDVRRALALFDGVWAQLAPRERTRVLSLLIERITWDGRMGEVAITFRPSAPSTVEHVA